MGEVVFVDCKKVELFKKNIHRQMMDINRRIRQSYDEERYVRQNRVLLEYCLDPHRPFYEYASIVNERYGDELDEYDIEDVLRYSGLRGSYMREKLLKWAENLAELFQMALISGKAKDFKQFKEWRQELFKNSLGRPYYIQERLGCLMLYARCPELQNPEDLQVLVKCNDFMARCQLRNITDNLSAYCGAGISTSRTKNMQLSLEQGKRRIEELECELEKNNMVIRDLQEELEDRMSEMQTDMLISFFGKLNSPKYGHILDQMYSLRDGFKKLQKHQIEVPPEISGVTGIIGNLYKFFSGYTVKKIREKDAEFKATRDDLLAMEQDCVLMGELPAEGEEKLFKVISPGWRHGDSGAVISKSEIIAVLGHEEDDVSDH